MCDYVSLYIYVDIYRHATKTVVSSISEIFACAAPQPHFQGQQHMNCSPIRGGVPVLSRSVRFCVRFSRGFKENDIYTFERAALGI